MNESTLHPRNSPQNKDTKFQSTQIQSGMNL